jgi:peptidyl-prolyl cis-trans isomerase D
MDAVFTDAEKSPPESAPTTQGFAVFDLLSIKPQSTPTLDEVHAKVEEEFKNERANILLSQKTQELSDRAKADHDLKKAAKELGAALKTSELVAPDGQVPDIGSMTGQAAVAFTMKPGEISGPINSGSNGVVLAVTEVQAPTEADFAAKRDEIRDTLLQAKEQELFGLFVNNLRDQMEKSGKIKINQDELKTLTRAGSEPGL